MPSLAQIVEFADEHLRIGEIGDWDNALNGLQVQNSGHISKIGAAVDISTRVLQETAKRKIDFLVVHHGLFWPGLQPVTRSLHRQLKLAFESNIAVYSAHLPLDVHPVVGNNARLAASIGFKSTKPFLEEKGQPIGVKATGSLSREDLIRRLKIALDGPVKSFNFGPKKPRRIGIVSGGAGSEIHRVVAEDIDTFITGEAPHWAAIAAEELEVNLLLGGHYATETFGVKALAAHLAKRFKIPWTFIDYPTGL
jgi:dinuclear metal center YbgI/SA1388 family protein